MSDERQAWLDREFPPDSPMHREHRGRFLARVGVVADETSCWEWVATRRTAQGPVYGTFYSRRTNGKQPQFKTHRMALEMASGYRLPPGIESLHRCDNPPCCRPSHLWPGTKGDNAADREAKGRWWGPVGERHPLARIRDEDVPDILARVASGVERYRDIGADYGVSATMILRIKQGKAHWRTNQWLMLAVLANARPMQEAA